MTFITLAVPIVLLSILGGYVMNLYTLAKRVDTKWYLYLLSPLLGLGVFIAALMLIVLSAVSGITLLGRSGATYTISILRYITYCFILNRRRWYGEGIDMDNSLKAKFIEKAIGDTNFPGIKIGKLIIISPLRNVCHDGYYTSTLHPIGVAVNDCGKMLRLLIVILRFIGAAYTSSMILRRKDDGLSKGLIEELNRYRSRNGDSFMLAQLGRISIRDPYSHPMRTHFAFSDSHPFVYTRSGVPHEA